MTTVADIITNVAEHFGLDPVCCLACAWQESGLDPNAVQVGVPFSEAGLGLYQLTPGGELGDLTEAQALNPATNATVALTEFAAVKASTGLSGGALAAAAQRPFAPVPYAADVDGFIAAINAGTMGSLYAERCAALVSVPLPFPQGDDMADLKLDTFGDKTVLVDVGAGTYRDLTGETETIAILKGQTPPVPVASPSFAPVASRLKALGPYLQS